MRRKGSWHPLNGPAFSPAGDHTITQGSDDRFRLWTSDGAFLRVLKDDIASAEPYVQDAEFSNDGSSIVTTGIDGVVRFRDTVTGTLQGEIQGPEDGIGKALFSQKDNLLLGWSRNQTITHYSVDDGSVLQRFEGYTDRARSISFSPEGVQLASVDNDRVQGDVIRIWSVADGLLRTNAAEEERIDSATFSPVDDVIATVGARLVLWDANDGRLIRAIDGHDRAIRCVAFSPDGQCVLTGSFDTTAKLWSVQGGELLHTFEGHERWVSAVAFSPDARYALTGSPDLSVKLWSTEDGSLVRTFEGHFGWINSVNFSPDGNHILTSAPHGEDVNGSGDSARLWSVADGTLKHFFGYHKSGARFAGFSPNGKTLLITGHSPDAGLWSTANNGLIASIVSRGAPGSAAYSPDGRFVATGDGWGIAKLWNISELADKPVLQTSLDRSASPGAAQLSISFPSDPEKEHIIEYKDSLQNDTPWQPFNGNLGEPGNVTAPIEGGQRFFRLKTTE